MEAESQQRQGRHALQNLQKPGFEQNLINSTNEQRKAQRREEYKEAMK